MNLILLGVFAVAYTVLVAIVRGFVLMFLYDWFVQATFGLPHISVATAIGIALLFSYTINTQRKIEDEKLAIVDGKLTMVKNTPSLGEPIVVALTVLLIGFIVHQFV